MISTERPNERLLTLSLFTGAAGLDLGVERVLDCEPIAYVEKQEVFCRALRSNVSTGQLAGETASVLELDLGEVDYAQLRARLGVRRGELDLLLGGPPCQAFSTAGRRQTVRDPRGELLWTFLRAIEEFQPRWFLMENVRGLLSAALRHRRLADRPDKGGPPLEADEQPGSVVDLWISDLERVGPYRVDAFEVNAVNYGAPQLRERVLFFGNRVGQLAEFPPPTHGDGLSLMPFQTLADALADLNDPDPTLLDFSPRKKRFLC